MPKKPRLTEARVIAENEEHYNMEVIFDNGHRAPLDVLKNDETRFTAGDRISETYIYRNLYGQHHFKREPEEEKAKAREIINSAIEHYRK